MDQEEAQAMAAATERVISLNEYVEELKQLSLDFDTYLRFWIPATYKQDRDGILLQERMRELGITSDREVQS